MPILETGRDGSLTLKPLAIDLYCGLGGWSEGLLAECWEVVGFDIERHCYPGMGPYPAQLVLQDVLTIHGEQFRGIASLIVASPPCQFFSRMAMPFKMPWSQEEYERRKLLAHSLFWAPFRIAHEAQLPLIVENVCGAQKWIGRSRYAYGSFHLWGDVPALMPEAVKHRKVGGINLSKVGFNVQACRNLKERMKSNPGTHDRTEGPNRPRFIQEGTKMGGGWWNDSTNSLIRKASSRSNARKMASAAIAKIPEELARHIARTFKP